MRPEDDDHRRRLTYSTRTRISIVEIRPAG
ncbi:hypothetical protein FHU28_000010 [Micromonospora echinospora]|uniref:Uncharacterized protein n=1 Tax=Micromonospora echinospora TaxID=1877 RepID=A0ABR6M447_MICEC|nr:hypothetical protein [Micromonospora echinospora]